MSEPTTELAPVSTAGFNPFLPVEASANVGPRGADEYVDMSEVERLAGQGLDLRQISVCIGKDEQFLSQLGQRSRHKIRNAVERGKAKGLERVTGSLMASCDRGSIEAQKFFLSRRAPKQWGAQRETDLFADLGLENVSIDQLELVVAKLSITTSNDDASKLLDL